jgi:hypothetical protein
MENLINGLKTGGKLTKEIAKNHVPPQNPDPFINLFWRSYTGRLKS